MKFSECVNQCAEMWVDWVAQNKIAIDKDASPADRRQAAVNAEALLKKRYILIEEVNKIFKE